MASLKFPLMASFQVLLFLLLCSLIFLFNQVHAQISHLQNYVAVPVTRDALTLQYVTKIYDGTPLVPIKVVIDLGGPFLWVGSASARVSSSERVIPRCSIQCSTAMANNLGSRSCFLGTRPTYHHTTCDIFTENSITRSTASGELVEDILAVGFADGSKLYPITTVNHFLFSRASTFLLNGLASGVQGMLGLGRTRVALPSQLASAFDFHRKFVTCLSSSSNGVILFGNVPSDSISRSLMYTPLVTNPDGNTSSQEYFIKAKSIKINGKRVSLNQEGIGKTKISTIVPYTTMESSIYNAFIEAFAKAATSMNMSRVAPVAPFGLCFSTKGIASTMLGPLVPTIDIVLQSEMVKWRVHGRNSMVSVSYDVMCLGVLDGGLNLETSVVIGGFQLEDTVVEFDLGTSMLGFSSSLLTRQTSCSKFMLESMLKESL